MQPQAPYIFPPHTPKTHLARPLDVNVQHAAAAVVRQRPHCLHRGPVDVGVDVGVFQEVAPLNARLERLARRKVVVLAVLGVKE